MAGDDQAITAEGARLGISIWWYTNRLELRWPEVPGAGWEVALGTLDRCRALGAGCLQTGVWGWTRDIARRFREKSEQAGITLQGQVGLPWDGADLGRFESELVMAQEAGADVVHTVCLNGRRYEQFSSADDWRQFEKASREALERAAPVLARHRMKLAFENHKDWLAGEQVALLEDLGSEWIGCTLDFGNNLSLLEDPGAVVEALAPYAFTTHIKDIALARSDHGFRMSEVPLGQGILDLSGMIETCRRANPQIEFNLEMITRNPLEIPAATDRYRATFASDRAMDLARTMAIVRKCGATNLTTVDGRSNEELLAFEEANIEASFEFARLNLGLGSGVTPSS